ncbi:MAG: hypothetical protein NTY53_23450 [Kiritimatiellaeota bacterium]|nr:hypothetical protein [Kiritimatiellota bacterium]
MATDWTRAKELLAGAQSRRQSYVSVPELDLKVLIRRWPKIDDDQQALVVQYLDAYTDPKNGEGAVTLKVTEPQAGKKPYPGDWYLVSNRGADPKNAQDAPGVVQTLVQYSDDLTLTTRKDGEVVVTEQTKAFPTRGLAAAWLATIFTNPITGAIKQGSLHQAENGWVVQLGTQTPQAWDTADVVYHDLWGDTTFRAWGNQTKGFSDARKTSLAAGLQNGFQARLDAATGLWSGSYVITQPTGGGGGTPWHTCEQTGIITSPEHDHRWLQTNQQPIRGENLHPRPAGWRHQGNQRRSALPSLLRQRHVWRPLHQDCGLGRRGLHRRLERRHMSPAPIIRSSSDPLELLRDAVGRMEMELQRLRGVGDGSLGSGRSRGTFLHDPVDLPGAGGISFPFQVYLDSTLKVREGMVSVFKQTTQAMVNTALSEATGVALPAAGSIVVFYIKQTFTDGEPDTPTLENDTALVESINAAVSKTYDGMATDAEMRWLVGFGNHDGKLTQCHFGNLVVPRIS